MRTIDSTFLRELVQQYPGTRGRRQRVNIDGIGPYLQPTMRTYHIDTFLREAHFLGQVCEESFGLSDVEEEASGREYEGRKDLGNTQPGDGARYKGRGLIQVTGRSNYKKVGKELRLDLVDDPDLAESPKIAVETACQYWKDHNLNMFADRDDIKTITLRINGGLRGLKDRQYYTDRAKSLRGSAGA